MLSKQVRSMLVHVPSNSGAERGSISSIKINGRLTGRHEHSQAEIRRNLPSLWFCYRKEPRMSQLWRK